MPDCSYRTVTPYLKLSDSGRLLEFLKTAFGAVKRDQLVKPDGKVLHTEMYIGDTLVTVHELPDGVTPEPSMLHLRVENTDAAFERAIAAGAVPVFEPTDMYYGERTACVTDVSGNDWWIVSPLECLSMVEIQNLATEFLHYREKAPK